MRSILEYFKQPIKMYRSGVTQNIKIFTPRTPDKVHDDMFRSKSLIYATSDPGYAAGFCFDWPDDEGFEFGNYNNGPWKLEVPKKYKDRLNPSCSLYELENKSFKRIDVNTPEYYSEEPVKVIKENKFDSCYDCLKKYGVRLKFV